MNECPLHRHQEDGGPRDVELTALRKVAEAARALDAAMVDSWGAVSGDEPALWDAPAAEVTSLREALSALAMETRCAPSS